MKAKKIITVDLGGTKILSAILNSENEIIERVKLPTNYTNGADVIVKDIISSINELLSKTGTDQKDLRAVCLGVPGTVNPETGIIGNAPNLKIKNYNIKRSIQKHIEVPVLIENDVNLAGLGIKRFEYEDKLKNALVVFVGTGIGGALIFNGKMYRGSSFYAGEIGHIKVNDKGEISANGKATFEQIASRTAVVKSIQKDIKKGETSVLSKLVPKGKRIKSKALQTSVKKRDKVVTKHINNSCRIIGSVLGSLTTLLNIDTIVLGGGVVEALGDYMLPKIEKSFAKSVLPEPGKIVKIKITKLGDDAPLFGGLALADEFLA
jgi:glucokinase